jgi:hypothetical protein
MTKKMCFGLRKLRIPLIHVQGAESPLRVRGEGAERCREYYMGEGGGFPRIRAMVSLVNPRSPVACLSIKSALKSELTNLLVGWMQIRVSNQKLVTLPSPIQSFNTPPLPLLVLQIRERTPGS